MTQHSYFRSSGYLSNQFIKTDSGNNIDLTQIPSFLRTLMVTDGTVTKSLEAWFWEPVSVEVVSNQLESLLGPVEGLEVKSGDRVLQREVILLGQNTHQKFACARSTVSIKHLPSDIGDSLGKGEIGIGELLREKGVETYRDIFDIDYISEINKNDALLSKLAGELLSRSYRIRVNGIAAIIVTEYFPVGIY
ncbi:MAG: chorismate pyruvate-lyase family protein [Cocleimonas sp.]